jgi:hypothetical protein
MPFEPVEWQHFDVTVRRGDRFWFVDTDDMGRIQNVHLRFPIETDFTEVQEKARQLQTLTNVAKEAAEVLEQRNDALLNYEMVIRENQR